ncbi:hypothetical protein SLEP1_g14487 [Rubroshorea leprosula]|uniref:Transposase (putative) gypsy type domain-containing protein n=1 Tax=Rubroshorea leprosula TaxID=152421 RepID=A0AAV5IUP3_9ROSI|nr:hypothetical protein SLEP1_g14487 [Rubroshorea leprosula]
MASFQNARELQGNQGGEDEVDVISVEPITMIVPSELQDLPRTITLESSASSSATGGSGDRRSLTSSNDSSAEETPSEAEGIEEVGCSALAISVEAEVVVFEGWESKVISGRLDNLRKAPKTLLAGFRVRAALHHEVADGAAIVKGYKKLEEMVRQYQIPKTIPIRVGTPNERACSVSRTGWVPMYVDHFDADLHFPLLGLIFDVLAEYELALSQLTPNSIKFIIGFMLFCERLGMPMKAVVFRSLFLCRLCPFTSGTRWINNELAARLSEWRTPNAYMNYPQLTIGDVDLKNQLLDHVKARGLVDLEALVTPEQLALLGFVDVANLHGEAFWKGSVNEHKARGTVELGPVPNIRLVLTSGHQLHRGAVRRTEEDSDVEDDIPLIWQTTSTGSQPASTAAVRLANVPLAPARHAELVPHADRQRAKGYVQQHGGHAALLKLMDGVRVQNRELQQNCKQLASEKASLADEVSRFQSSEMANRAASAESRADELAASCQEGGGCVENRAKKAKSDREKTLHELNALKERVLEADLHVAWAEASLEKTKRHHQRDVCFAQAQGAKWLVGVDMFQDAVAVASANTTTDIFNEVRGKVLRHRADFPIGELAFFEGEEIDEEGKSLALPVNTRVRLKWELNEKGLPVWPPSVVEEGEDTEGLPSFDAWVAKPSSTPPSSQPAPAAALALSPPDRSSPARSVTAPTDASIPVNLMDD